MIFQLTEEIVFPHPNYAEPDGLLAVGGDLSTERLLLAYENGIFPWYSENEPILWYAPNPRCVLFPEKVKVSKSMKKWRTKTDLEVTYNQDFKQVIRNCKDINREDQDGTWITNEMEKAYLELFRLGFAQSVEIWTPKNELVGGLYGVELNGCFFGESMFHKVSNASKLALISLCENKHYKIIDCQMHTSHLESLGAEMIDFEHFFNIIT